MNKLILLFAFLITTTASFGFLKDNYSRLAQIGSEPPVLNSSYTNGLIAYWPLRSDLQDYGLYKTDLTCTSCPQKRNGFNGQTFYFTNNFFNFSDANLTTGNIPFTVSFWYKSDNTLSHNILTIGRQELDSSILGIIIGSELITEPSFIYSIGVKFLISDQIFVTLPDINLTPQNWYYCTIINDPVNEFPNYKFYFSGVQINNARSDLNDTPLSIDLTGTGTVGSVSSFGFYVNDIAIWNRALTSNEIYNIYTNNGSLFIK
jgi:hypothetical protein